MSSAASLAAQGAQALNTQKYQDAIALYTRAIAQSPTAVDYYIKRSTAHQRSAHYESALQDAEIAVLLGHQRGKRESIGQAQLRRGISLYLLERYGDAGFCFGVARKFLGEKEKSVGMWISKLELVLRDTEKIGEEDVRREVMVKEMPEVRVPSQEEVVQEAKALGEEVPSAKEEDGEKKVEVVIGAVKEDEKKASGASSSATLPLKAASSMIAAQSPASTITPRDKIRNEWYQTPTHIVFTLYVKNAPKDKTTVEIEEQSISISFPYATSSSDFTFDLDPLFAAINPSESSFSVLSTKIELKLAKAVQGQKWKTLEGAFQAVPPTAAVADSDSTTIPAAAPVLSPLPPVNKPVYPTSSKSGPKNWDKLLSAEDDLDEEDPVNGFFKKLYKDADEDTKRAMMKSYIESNGTALSTNWKEVGAKKVDTSPPEGLVAKKWDE